MKRGGRVQATGLAEQALVLGEARRQRPHHRSRRRPGRGRPGRTAPRGRRAQPCRRSRTRSWRGTGVRGSRPTIGRRSRSVTTLYCCSPSSPRQYAIVSMSSGARDEPFGAAEPGRELEVVARRAHRHRERGRGSTGPVHAQLERLLGDELVGSAARAESAPTASTCTAVTGRRTGAAEAVGQLSLPDGTCPVCGGVDVVERVRGRDRRATRPRRRARTSTAGDRLERRRARDAAPARNQAFP